MSVLVLGSQGNCDEQRESEREVQSGVPFSIVCQVTDPSDERSGKFTDDNLRVEKRAEKAWRTPVRGEELTH
nr:hypothetical protein CFP56_21645 [Quercus suber]